MNEINMEQSSNETEKNKVRIRIKKNEKAKEVGLFPRYACNIYVYIWPKEKWRRELLDINNKYF